MKGTFEDAVIFAANAHRGAKRKGKDRAYILHPLEVAVIVSTLTTDEAVLAAAVLHDTVEDTPATREDISTAFGEDVARLVAAESENKRENLPAASTWQIRKQETVEHLRSADKETKLICLGDKLANLREIARDHDMFGEALWQRFNQKDKRMHEWYYRSIFEILAYEFGPVPPIEEYRTLLTRVFGE